jgi:NTE family protein
MRAIVLSGGGAKGSYEIGVWQALKKLNIKYDLVTGTSIGALNGALMVQNTFIKSLFVWNNLTMTTLFGSEMKKIPSDEEVIKMYGTNFLKSNGKGTDTTMIEAIIKKALNLNKFYHSPLNYGLITFEVDNLKPCILTKNDIPKDKLYDYLTASSACYPALAFKEINGHKYIDGGYYDNLPINLAIDMGATEVIAVDLEAPGLKKPTKKNISITTIKPNNKLTNFLNFNPAGAKKNMLYGYNDTMKVFNKLEGHKYTFKLGELTKNQNIYQATYYYILDKVINTTTLTNSIKDLLKITRFDNDIKAYTFTTSMEAVGEALNIDDTKIYRAKRYNKKLLRTLKRLLKEGNNSSIITMYSLLLKEDYVPLRKILLKEPTNFLKALYLYSIKEC